MKEALTIIVVITFVSCSFGQDIGDNYYGLVKIDNKISVIPLGLSNHLDLSNTDPDFLAETRDWKAYYNGKELNELNFYLRTGNSNESKILQERAGRLSTQTFTGGLITVIGTAIWVAAYDNESILDVPNGHDVKYSDPMFNTGAVGIMIASYGIAKLVSTQIKRRQKVSSYGFAKEVAEKYNKSI